MINQPAWIFFGRYDRTCNPCLTSVDFCIKNAYPKCWGIYRSKKAFLECISEILGSPHMLCICFYVAFRWSPEDEILLEKAHLYFNNVGLWTSDTSMFVSGKKGFLFWPEFLWQVTQTSVLWVTSVKSKMVIKFYRVPGI